MPLDKPHLNAKKGIYLKEMAKEFQTQAAKFQSCPMTPSSRGKRSGRSLDLQDLPLCLDLVLLLYPLFYKKLVTVLILH